jgi:hypothetical protein
MDKNNELIGIISIVGADIDNLPMWSINKYSEEFCNNYNKIMTVRRICELMHDGAYDDEFFVAKKSEELFPSESANVTFTHETDRFVRLATKSQNPEEFWRIIKDYVRPVVFYTGGDVPIKLVDYTDDGAIKIRKLSYNSPPSWDIQGTINGLIDVANAGNRRAMEEESHISNQIGAGFENMERYARASQVINDPRTPEGVKHYANNLLNDLTKKQEKLNKKLDIRVNKIDIRR